MIDLTGKVLPNTIMVEGRAYSIYTDYRKWLKFAIEFDKWNKKDGIQIDYLFKNDIPIIYTEEQWGELMNFYSPRNIVPRSSGGSSSRVLDYEIDSDLIYSAFMQVYGIDLLIEDIHWHRFLALQNGLTKDTKLCQVIGYRCYEGKDKGMLSLQNAWELPQIQTDEDIEQEREFNEYFG